MDDFRCHDGESHPCARATSPGPGYVLGVSTSSNVNYNRPLLSTSGVGAVIMPDNYEVLPSEGDPDGVRGSTTNLWAAMLR